MIQKLKIGKNVIKKVIKIKDLVNNNNVNNNVRRGSNCSLSGMLYEQTVLKICKKLRISKQGIVKKSVFCKKTINDLGGSSSEHDLVCNFHGMPINIEIKKCASPDWMQVSIMKTMNNWHAKHNSKIPTESVNVFNELIKDYVLFNNRIPTFMHRKITHDQWVKIKKRNTHFRDTYIKCESDIISKLYKAKGTHYIQVSDHGLFHTGEDPCCFGVPFFECPQELRVRTKIHSRNISGHLKASVIVAAKPIDVTKLEISNVSLDNLDNLPENLTLYKNVKV